jgi:hypothetical protein
VDGGVVVAGLAAVASPPARRASVRAGAVIATLLLIVGIGADADAAQAARTFFAQSQDLHSLAYKPRVLEVAGEGSFIVTDMRWRAWGHSSARGSGIGAKDDCEPDCATGGFHKAPARVTLRRPRRRCGHRVWTKMVLVWTSGPPGDLPYPLDRREVWRLAQFPC